jgi:hypothetical protein
MTLLLTENAAERLTICREPIETYLNDDRIRALWGRYLPALLTHVRLDADAVARGEVPDEWTEYLPPGESAADLERMIAHDPGGVHESIVTAYSTELQRLLPRLHRCPTEWWGEAPLEEFSPLPAHLMVYLVELETRGLWKERIQAFVLREAAALASGEETSRDACFDRMVQVGLTDDGVAISTVDMQLPGNRQHPLYLFKSSLKRASEPVESDGAAVRDMLEELRNRREEHRAREAQ